MMKAERLKAEGACFDRFNLRQTQGEVRIKILMLSLSKHAAAKNRY
jgi:hypothetical protein